MTTREKLRANMEPRKFYTFGELRKLLCPTQTTTAEYMLQDAIACGYIQEGQPPAGQVNRVFRINQ
jgi:hypothetical protein